MKNLDRRDFLKFGTMALGTGIATTVMANVAQGTVPSNKNAATKQENPADLSPDEVFNKLMEGNKRFVENKRQSPNQDSARLIEIAKGQAPFAAILSCADSRVPAEIVFDRGLGDLFVVRDAGNIATPEEIGSLEFGTLVLGAKVLLVMGHTSCGAVQAAIKGGSLPGQIGSIVDAILPAVQSSEGQPGDQLENATKANVMLQIENLKASPVISQLITDGKLKIVGAVYDLNTGEAKLI
ncbi:MAG: carbonic anhydrase [Gomphosphaeria aponina SAG 52.96 = DSM 107014]|uniref:carbonic anhydrase n=1 Tax=Gomphosphaeria aponina SAG 52.96 = DSM 107014 TaxID=1521640 RepID=A0A941JPV5_9CHRO|nr:carbonic anhydrase [Gomphosphaeria aponina SAG 52.96 = DSM 107014]